MVDTTVDAPVDAPEATTQAPAAPEAPKAPKGPSRAELAAQIAALTQQMAERDNATAETLRAATAESERLAADRVAVEAERKALVAEARQAAADKLGILPKALALTPDVDPRTPEGAKTLTDWAQANPEFVRSAHVTPSPYEPAPKSPLAKILSGEMKHPLLPLDHLLKVLGR